MFPLVFKWKSNKTPKSGIGETVHFMCMCDSITAALNLVHSGVTYLQETMQIKFSTKTNTKYLTVHFCNPICKYYENTVLIVLIYVTQWTQGKMQFKAVY